MSSQGPALGGTTAYGFPFATGPTGGSPLDTKGYTFSKADIRDGSDWTSYRRQLLILKETKSKVISDPWFSHGNDYRIQYQLGRFKGGIESGPVGCTGCSSNAFGSTGPY